MKISMEETRMQQGQRSQRPQKGKRLRRRKRRRALYLRVCKIGIAALAIVLLFLAVIKVEKDWMLEEDTAVGHAGQNSISGALEEQQNSDGTGSEEGTDGSGETASSYGYSVTEEMQQLGEEITSERAIFVNVDEKRIFAGREEMNRIVPASMTKVLTVLVAAEHIDNWDEAFTITTEITDYCYVNGCSIVGFDKDETVTIRDLLYGTILPSGADAAVGLAVYTAGSQEAFVEMMNAKLAELGLSDTAHFTNCVGLYDENHYCTVYDMAVIMAAAIDNELCREVLSARTYTTSPTPQHPEGLTISNWFLRRIEDKDTGGSVLCGKTGYVEQSGNCAVSFGVDHNGRNFICVTTNAENQWKCIEDHVSIYKRFSDAL